MFGCQHKHVRSPMLQRRKIDVQHMPEISQQRNKSLCSRCYLDLLSLQCISNYFRQKKTGYFFLQFPSFPEDFDWGLNIPNDMLLLCRLILILPLLSCRLQVSNTNLEIVPFVNIQCRLQPSLSQSLYTYEDATRCNNLQFRTY